MKKKVFVIPTQGGIRSQSRIKARIWKQVTAGFFPRRNDKERFFKMLNSLFVKSAFIKSEIRLPNSTGGFRLSETYYFMTCTKDQYFSVGCILNSAF
jgi:hypothetical protein